MVRKWGINIINLLVPTSLGSTRLWTVCHLTSTSWWEFQCLQNRSNNVIQDVISSLQGGTKDPWLCLMAKLSLFCLARLFLSFRLFSLLWLNLSFGTQGRLRRLSLSPDEVGYLHKRSVDDVAGGGCLFWEGPIGSCSVTVRLWVFSLFCHGVGLERKQKHK